MAIIVNERDKILQATADRLVDVTLPENIIPEAVKSISLTPLTGIFKTNAAGTSTTPSSIDFTITRKYVTNTATWTVTEGTATLTGTGDTRTLAFTNMTSERVVIQASVTQDSKTYVATATATKVKDGTNGTPGQRGTQDLYVIGSSWSDATANAAILSATGSSTKYAGDKVTIYNNAGFAETKYWDGISAWVTGQIINGNLLVSGTVTANKIGVNELYAISIKATVPYSIGVTSDQASLSGYNNASGGNQYGVIGYATSNIGVYGYSGASTGGAGVLGVGYVGVQGTATNVNGVAVVANHPLNGVALSMTGTLQWSTASGPAVTWARPPATGTYQSQFLCADGTWKTALRVTGTSPTAGASLGYLILSDGVNTVKVEARAV